MKRKLRNTPLMIAASDGDLNRLNASIRAGRNVNRKNAASSVNSSD